MKNLVLAIVSLLAINFLALAGGTGWLFQSGHLSRDRVKAIKEIVFPPETQPTTAPSKPQPAVATEQSAQSRLDALLERKAGVKSAAEQADYLQQAFDAQMSLLDQRQRQIEDLQRQLDFAQQQSASDRAQLLAAQAQLSQQRDNDAKLAADQGFQDTLNLYNSMQSKQVKEVFLGMKDETVVSYLRAMDPKTAAKILKEFKTPDELDRVHKLMDLMREPIPSTQPVTGQ